MLDPNALAKLSQLKNDIEASKDYAEGTVAATSGRYGFVRTDDGRDAFLSPEKMDHFLPGDRVKICVITNEKGKFEAEVEKLISSELNKFVGQYRVKGAGHFVAPSGHQSNRWIFIPPAQRKNIKNGDFVIAKLSKHPYKDGKAQANIVFRIGQPDDNYIEHKYTKAKYDLNYRQEDKHNKQVNTIQEQYAKHDFGVRADAPTGTFFTIDSASTLDMDDALSITQNDENGHFLLKVAIADPSFFIPPASPLAKQAQECSQSVYLLGGAVPMLPAALAHNVFSLEQDKLKPVLLCALEFDAQGQVVSSEFSFTQITSQHKLGYQQVAAFLDGSDEQAVPESLQQDLKTAYTFAQVRRQFRASHQLVADDHDDYDFQLNDQGKIDNIVRRERNSAQIVVEEAMIATNQTAGEFLATHNQGLHMRQKGFREERIGEVHALLKEENIEHAELNTLAGYIALHTTLAQQGKKEALLPALRRILQASELHLEAGPHLGLGTKHYATVTSPIRRFADLYNHWCIRQILQKEEAKAADLNDASIATLNEQIRVGRQADRELQQWLICQFVSSLIDEKARGKVRIVTQQGFGVKLHSNGIEGFVLFPKSVEKSFDAKRMTLTVGERCFHINDDVDIVIRSVDMDKHRIAFELAEEA